ncbi:MAG: adenylosuccinate lyase, partial [Opitutales bacterium]
SVLMAAVRAGAGRESAQEAIKEHGLAKLRDLQRGTARENDLFRRLAGDDRLGLSREQLDELAAGSDATGNAGAQVDQFCQAVDSWLSRFPEARDLRPGAML